jgi:DNA repair exonuclease SbcCD ATPase subunit
LAQSELDQLEERRAKAAAQLDDIEGEILAYKKKRQGELLAELEGLGLSMPGAKSAVGAGDKKITRQRDPNKPCPVCGETGHDARRHRSGSEAKKIHVAGQPAEEEDVPLPM